MKKDKNKRAKVAKARVLAQRVTLRKKRKLDAELNKLQLEAFKMSNPVQRLTKAGTFGTIVPEEQENVS